MSDPLPVYTAHHAILAQLLNEQRALLTPGLPAGVRITMEIYLHILEDALSVLDSLIHYLTPSDSLDRREQG